MWDFPVFFRTLTPQRMGSRSRLLVPLYPFRCTSPRSSQFRVANHGIMDLVGNDRSIIILSDTSLPRVVDHDVLFLCVCFAVPSTVGSLLLDDVVRDGESIQSPLMKIWAWFAFSQETSTSGINSSLIPMKKHRPCHESSSLIFTKWVVDVILLQVGLKCSSMRVKVNVYFLVLCEQTDGLSTFNKSLRSY